MAFIEPQQYTVNCFIPTALAAPLPAMLLIIMHNQISVYAAIKQACVNCALVHAMHALSCQWLAACVACSLVLATARLQDNSMSSNPLGSWRARLPGSLPELSMARWLATP